MRVLVRVLGQGLVDRRKIEPSTSTVQALIKCTAVHSQLAGSLGMAARLSPQHVIKIQHGMVKKIIQGITLGVGGQWPATICGAQDNVGMVVECAANRICVDE